VGSQPLDSLRHRCPEQLHRSRHTGHDHFPSWHIRSTCKARSDRGTECSVAMVLHGVLGLLQHVVRRCSYMHGLVSGCLCTGVPFIAAACHHMCTHLVNVLPHPDVQALPTPYASCIPTRAERFGVGGLLPAVWTIAAVQNTEAASTEGHLLGGKQAIAHRATTAGSLVYLQKWQVWQTVQPAGWTVLQCTLPLRLGRCLLVNISSRSLWPSS
jgi:hypothetical protein